MEEAMEVEETDISDENWRGISLLEIQKSCDSQQLPPIRASSNHCVLFELPVVFGEIPIPRLSCCDAWDRHHVRLPCSPESLLYGNNGVECRWNFIKESLMQPIGERFELYDAILSYNMEYKDSWNFKTLDTYLRRLEKFQPKKYEAFFSLLLPQIISLALALPSCITSPISLLRQHSFGSVSLSQHQVVSLLANSFLCTFPERYNHSNDLAEYKKFPSINFDRLLNSFGQVLNRNVEKLKCIFHYFERVTAEPPSGVLTFTRLHIPKSSLPRWDRLSATLPQIHVSSEGCIEDQGARMLQVDFANRIIGGGVLSNGCVQEEIRFVICPELIVSRLFTEELCSTEALLVSGCERFSSYSGYGDTFRWAGDYQDKTTRDSSNRINCSVVAIDALQFAASQPNQQFSSRSLLRELNKAFVGFNNLTVQDINCLAPIATGNWGCGAFNGIPQLKALIQIMAAAVARRKLVYFTFNDKKLMEEIYGIHTFLTAHNVTVGTLWKMLVSYNEGNFHSKTSKWSDFYSYLYSTCLPVSGPSVGMSDRTLEYQTHSDHNKTENNLQTPSGFLDQSQIEEMLNEEEEEEEEEDEGETPAADSREPIATSKRCRSPDPFESPITSIPTDKQDPGTAVQDSVKTGFTVSKSLDGFTADTVLSSTPQTSKVVPAVKNGSRSSSLKKNAAGQKIITDYFSLHR